MERLLHSNLHSRMPSQFTPPLKEIFVSAREDDLSAIAAQESELCFINFDEERAWTLGSRLRTMAVARKAGIVIDVRRFGQPLFYSALGGTSPDNVWGVGAAISGSSSVPLMLHWNGKVWS